MPERPPPAISRSGAAEIRPLTEADYPFVASLNRIRDNANIAPSAAIEDPGFIAAVRAEPWSTPMMLAADGEPVAVAMIGAADTQHRHGRLVVLAVLPREVVAPLTMYLRHVFWSYPLHRLYVVLPSRVAAVAAYADLLRSCGFVQEGTMVGHLRVATRMIDLDLFGLLRPEFDEWCRQNRPALALDG
ncbi:MAG TPA: GNAT family protein [Candidatus Dormibacteraeota bacterium]|nr:GNAT family protein [Candidatus Dormibacteraeota bacterium]